MYEVNRCGICSRGQEEHLQLEESRQINHQYNEAGNLVQVDRSTRRGQARTVPMVVGAIDVELRRILFKKGLITDADFAALHDPGAGAAGDREAGEPPSSR
jgi:hypothetical protein